MTPEQKNPSRPSGRQHDDHLQYLLTAYLFGNLSVAGREEVEGHLKDCAHCREELAGLRATLALTEEALHAERATYVFDDRRRARVLVAANQTRHGILSRLGLTSLPRLNRRWSFTALAALLFVAVVGGMLLSFLGATKSAARRAHINFMASDRKEQPVTGNRIVEAF